MFDCVLPTRSGRTGLAFTWEGKFNLKNSKYQKIGNHLDKNCDIRDFKQIFKKLFNHLIKSNEMIGFNVNFIK